MAVDEKVLAHLEAIKRQHGITILHAVEVGSRAWGLATDGSDHDIGFIYVRRPQDYFKINHGHRDDSVQSNSDVVMFQVDGFGDIQGWDISKALTMAYNSNPTIVDWLRLPSYYEADCMNLVRELMWEGFSTLKLRQMNVATVKRNYLAYIKGKTHVPVKKYIHTVRPLLNALWYERTAHFLGNLKDCPPYDYTKLCNVAAMDHDLLSGCIDLRQKRRDDKIMMERDARLDTWIEKLVTETRVPEGLSRTVPDITRYDAVFASIVLNQGAV